MEKRHVCSEKLTVQPIGVIHSCYSEKFGIPRQPGLADKAVASVVLFSPFNRAEMVKSLDQFSHIWLIFHFHDTVAEGWKATVRPPGLGGQERVGVFASRSPHRPNHLGLSVVKLLSVCVSDGSTILEVGGGDFLDGTPVLDIKPYAPFSDALPSAQSGYSAMGVDSVEVIFAETASLFCKSYKKRTGRDLAGLIEQVLAQDPRPASQRQRDKVFGVQLWDVNIRWRAQGKQFEVIECNIVQEPS